MCGDCVALARGRLCGSWHGTTWPRSAEGGTGRLLRGIRSGGACEVQPGLMGWSTYAVIASRSHLPAGHQRESQEKSPQLGNLACPHRADHFYGLSPTRVLLLFVTGNSDFFQSGYLIDNKILPADRQQAHAGGEGTLAEMQEADPNARRRVGRQAPSSPTCGGPRAARGAARGGTARSSKAAGAWRCPGRAATGRGGHGEPRRRRAARAAARQSQSRARPRR